MFACQCRLAAFDGHSIWFQSLHTEEQVRAVYDYIDAMLAAQSALPPPENLVDNVFDGFVKSSDAFPSMVESMLL